MALENVGEALNGLELGDGHMGIGCGRAWVAEDIDDVLGRLGDDLDGGGVGHLYMLREELDGICDAFPPCFGNVYPMASVMVHGRAEVPSLHSIWVP